MNRDVLVRMANDIARNFLALGHENAVAATADHIVTFWDPRMKAAIFAGTTDGLSPVAAAALDRLRRGEQPPSQSRATRFNAADEGGRSDAG